MGNKKIFVNKIIEVCDGTLVSGDENVEFISYTKDSREVKEGDVYLGIKGENSDGNDYVERAFESGALGCIIDKMPTLEVVKKYSDRVIVYVEDTVVAIQKIAKYKRSLYDIPVVAITGSVGKTSTKDIIAGVLGKKFNVLKTQGNYNNHIGLPLTILALREEHTAMVLEMGMNHAGEISVLTNIGRPTICVYTTIGTAHIGNLGSRENILKAKLEMLEGITGEKAIVFNNDNDLLHAWFKNQTEYNNLTSFGLESESDYVANEVETLEKGSKFKVNIESEEKVAIVNIAGIGFVYNSLSAIAVGKILGIRTDEILEGISNFELTYGRMQIEEVREEIAVINDCYNASNDSTKAALEVLRKMLGNKKIAVLGDMLELRRIF